MDKTPTNSETTTDQLQHLRDLLVGPTADSVQDLRKELDERTVSEDEIGELLPQAINKSSKKQLARALGPTLSDAFQDSIKRDPRSLVDAISPIMGPAIRRSISQQIQAMVQSLNKALDHSFSPKGIRWRIEAWRTGKPFAEVVLLHTLIYRTEQLLLIEPESGLLMQSVSADPGNEDADLVSSLLSAIQGFTRESFEHNTDEGSDLRVMRTNELTVLIEHGPQAILAAAVRGEIPVKFRTRMQAAAEQLHLQHGALLEKFDGDTALLEPVRVDLEELLESEYVDKKEEPKVTKPEPTWAKHLGWAIPTVLLFLALAWSLSAQRAKRQQRFESVLDLPPTASLTISESVLHLDGTARHEWLVHAKKRMERLPAFKLNASELVITDQNWVNFLEDLRGQLGIILVNTNRDDSGRYVLQGWRDPLAIDPDELLQKHGVNEEVQQTWEPYRSLDPRLTVERLKRQLGSFPDEVKLEPHEDTGWLYLRGTATRDWVQKLSRVIEDAELGHAVNISQLKIVDGFQAGSASFTNEVDAR